MSNYRTSVYFRCPGGTHRRITLRAETRIPDSKLPVKVSPIHTHQCRHTFATLCYLQGLSIPDTMQELGHAQPTVTIGIYTDLRSYHKFDLSAEFKKKLSTSYRIPLNNDGSNSKVDVIS